MAYAYKGDLTIEQELAAIEQEKADALARIEERRKQLAKLRSARREVRTLISHEHRLVTELHKLTGVPVPIAEPVHGGREGLKAAAEEIREFEARKRAEKVA